MPMKILHYIRTFSIPSETFLYNLICGIEEAGLDNTILTQERILEQERPFEKVIVVRDKKNLIEKALFKIFHNTPYEFYKPERFIKVIESVQPDIIHAHFGPMGVFIHNLLKMYNLNIPLVISFHGTDSTSMPKLDTEYASELKKLNNYDKIIFTANSNFLKAKLIEAGLNPKKIRLIHNSFNPLFNKFKKTEWFESGKEFSVINTGRLINLKGQKYLIEGFAKFLKEVYPQSKLSLIGYGKDEKKLRKLVKELGIEKNVKFLGPVKNSKIPGILQNHDIYVQPSIRDESTFQEEAFGVAILEAIAVGLPVIVTNTGGMPEVVMENNEQYSFVIPEKNSSAIYEILKMMVDGKYRFQDNEEYARKVMNKFSYENHIKNIVALYDELIKNEENT